MPVNLYCTQRVRGFQSQNEKFSKESVEIQIKRTKHQCPHCGSEAVTVEPICSRWQRVSLFAIGFLVRSRQGIQFRLCRTLYF